VDFPWNFRYKRGSEWQEGRMALEPLILFPPFRLDVLNEQLWRDNDVLPVRPKPFAVLAYLATHPGRLVPAAELRKAVWPNTYVGEDLLRGYIREVRLVLGDDPEVPRFIETIPRRGYRFLGEVVSSKEETRDLRRETGFSPLQASSLKSLVSSLVGRESELAQLHTWLGKALNGTRQVVFVLGEPGIGKTTVVDAFLHNLESAQVQSPKSKVQEDEEDQKSKGKNQKAKTGDLPQASSLKPQVSSPLIARGQCIEHYGSGEAYLPILEAMGHLCRQPGGEQLVTLLSRYAPTWLVQMPALVSDEELAALQRKVHGATRERMLREMAEALEALTAEQPLVLILEDLHWSDHATLDLLSLLAQRRGPARLLLLATYRPTDVIVSGHPLRVLKQELQVHGQCEELPLGFLTVMEVNQYLATRFPQHELPRKLAQLLHQSTEGNPLFMVNVVDEWVRQRVLVETDGQWKLTAKVEELAAGVPESLRQMIDKQLERLTPEEQRMIETASVVGGEFSTAAVAAGLEEQPERVEEWCDGLAKRNQFVRARGMETLAEGTVTGRYGFVHALYQQVLYERLAAVRRIHLHRRIGDWKAGAYGTRVREVAAELAIHFERGQDYERAVQYLTQAADNAMRRQAPHEAVALLSRGLTLLKALPDTIERTHHELALLVTLGIPLLMTKGYAAREVERTYARARELCQQVGESPQILPALAGLFRFYFVRAEFQTARALAEQVLRLAQHTSDHVVLLVAHSLLGALFLCLGEIVIAREHLEKGIALYDPQRHHFMASLYGDDPGVTCYCFAALTLWFLGYPDQALKNVQKALAGAQELGIPYSRTFALDFLTWIHVYRREERAAQAYIKMLMPIATEHGFQFLRADSMVLHGWVLVEQGQEAEGFAQLQPGIITYRATGAEMGRPSHLALLAKAYGKTGQTEEGLVALAEALSIGDKTGECSCEAELYRLKGELTWQQSRTSLEHGQGKSNASQKAKGKNKKNEARGLRLEAWREGGLVSSLQPLVPSEVEGYFLKAIDIARKQQAKSLELRAVMSLVRLRQQQATRHGSLNTQPGARTQLDEAHSMLSEVYTWFTEGFDTKDLQEAKALLESLVCPARKSRGGSLEAEARSRRERPGR
jgi:DNA-binding winged helix-turn-helix (wHTH) protein/predicted ATPase